MPATAEGLRVSVGLFTATLVNILSRKAKTAANKIRGLRAHGFAAKLAVTTLLAFLMMSGIEPNPGPTTPTASGRQEGEGDDSASNQPVLKELLEQMKTLTQAVSRLESAQIDSTAQMTARLDATEGKLSTRLEEVADEQTVLSYDVSAMYEHFEQMRTSNVRLQDHNEKLEDKLDALENQSRRSNVLFDGIPPSANETWEHCENKVLEIIRKKMMITKNIPIERAHRLGKTIIVRFQSFKDRELVVSRARELKGSSVYVREDASDRVRQKQRGLIPLMKTMREDGKRAVIRHDKLRSAEGTFTFDLKHEEIVKVDDRRLPPWEHRHQRQPPRRHIRRQCSSDNRKHAEREADRHSPTRDRVDDDGHNNEDFDSNLSQHRKGDNDHTRQHLGGFPPLRSRGREDNHSTGSSEKGNQRDRNREELCRPDHVSVRSSYSRRSVGTDRRRGSGRHVETDSRPVTRSQNHTQHHPSSDKQASAWK